MAAVPSIGRANRIEGVVPAEADLTRALYEQHANQIFRYCLHQLGSREEAEDAVQSTFLNAFRGIQRGVVPELESAWLFKIAHNVCLSRRRSTWRRGRIESPADFEVVEELAPAPSRRADELIGLQDVLEQMPESQRRAILLREWQGLSYREIAAELDLSQAAVETLIFRARRALASGLEQPPEKQRRRLARALDLGNLATAVKSLLVGGTAAAKVAATVAVVSATTVVAAEPVVQHRAQHKPVRAIPHAQPLPAQQTVTPAAAAPGASNVDRGAPVAQKHARAVHAASGGVVAAHGTVAPETPARAAPPVLPDAGPSPAAGEQAAPASGKSDDTPKGLQDGAAGPDKKRGDTRGKRANRGAEQPLVTVPAPATPPVGSTDSGSAKGGHGSHKGQGGGTDGGGGSTVDPSHVTIQPVAPPVTSLRAVPVVAQQAGRHDEERDGSSA